MIAGGLAGIVWAISFCILLFHSYYTEDSAWKRFELSIPGDIWLGVSALVFAGCFYAWGFGTVALYEKGVLSLVYNLVMGWILLAVFLYMTTTMVRRFREGRLYGGSLVQYVLRSIHRFLQGLPYVISRGKVHVLIALCLAGLSYILGRIETRTFRSFLFAAIVLYLLYLSFRKEIERSKLYRWLLNLSDLKEAPQIFPEEFHGEEKLVAEELIHLDEMIHETVEKQVRSERMQTDLVTNVSHDLRTPLTSIVNYVNLLEQLPQEDERAQHYIGVLKKKADTLHQLLDNLIDISKASSGNLELQIQTLDLREMVEQVLAEHTEEWEERHIEAVWEVSGNCAEISADGKQLFRVFDNLFTNVTKYAQEHTRVYLSLEEEEQSYIFRIRNVSKAPLNISPEKLLERFQRSDPSRSSEGSGLGLTIAKQLSELMGIRFELSIEGDLFRVCLTFFKDTSQ